VTFTELEPLLPSLVAVIVAVPVATAVTRPAGETVAAASLLDDQETVRPDRDAPPASATTTFAWEVSPSNSDAGAVTVTLATGGGGFTTPPPSPPLPPHATRTEHATKDPNPRDIHFIVARTQQKNG
jgi:hypothetical protein